MPKYEILLPGGLLIAKSINELIKKIEAEADFWSTFKDVNHKSISDQTYYAPPWVNQAVSYIQEISVFWPNRLQSAKNIASSGDDTFATFKSEIESAASPPPYSGSRVATLAKRLADKDKIQEAVALLVGASEQQFAQLGALQNQNMDHPAYISFGRSLAAFVDLYLESAGDIEAHTRATNDSKVIEGLSGDMGLLVTNAAAARDQYFAKSKHTANTFFQKLNRLREAEIRYFRNARTDERDRRQKQTDELKGLIETFNAHLRLKRPVDLWRERNTEHSVASTAAWTKFFWGAVLLAVCAVCVAVGLGGIIADSFIAPGCTIGTEPQCSRISARGPLNVSLLLVVTTTWLWYLRLQMRIFLSERHLALDARERMAFAETYLSLLKGAEVTREHETVVLQSLMRPTQDGIIKDESGPDFALSSILAKALERK